MDASTPHGLPRTDGSAAVPRGLVVTAAWAWRLLVIVVAAAALVFAAREASIVVVPLAVAVLFSALLAAPVRVLAERTPLRRKGAAAVVLLVAVLLILGLAGLAGTQLASGAGTMRGSAEDGLREVQDWLRTGPLHLSTQQLSDYMSRATDSLRGNSSRLTSGLLSGATTAGHFVAGLLIALIATFFYLSEGERIWRFFVRMLPATARDRTYEASRRGWVSLGHYARTQVLVAGVDAIGIGIGALALRLPFVLPLTLLVFLSSFIPIVGAILSGAVAVLIALVVKGPVAALVMFGVVLVVQQLETHVLQPFLMGRAVALHPLAVLVAVALGSYLLGIVGALFAVPALAFTNAVVRYWTGHDPVPSLGEAEIPDLREDEAVDPGDSSKGPAAEL